MYVTQPSRDLIEQLESLDAWAVERRRTASEAYERGLYDGYHAALTLAIEDCRGALEGVEQEARLIPEFEEDAMVWLEKQMADYPSMAGDYRDFPSDSAA
jgi:hypothetical protein